MKTKNKNYSSYISNYKPNWESTLDVISDEYKLDTLGGKIDIDPYVMKNEVLVIYNHDDRQAYERNMHLRDKYGSDVCAVYKEYGPAYLIIFKKLK